MRSKVKVMFSVAALLCVLSAASFAQVPYLQDFEGLAPVDGSLAADGWKIFGNVFSPTGGYLYGYGVFAAPNNIGNWCDIVSGEGGPDQESQQLVAYSDYANGDHAVGNLIEANLFQEQVIPAGATGMWYFTFDAKMGNLAGASTAIAFIKVLNPATGYSMTVFNTADMTNTPATWTGYMLSVDVTGLDGQILQFGFSSTATYYEPSGVFYDNVAFTVDGTIPNSEQTWSDVKSLYR